MQWNIWYFYIKWREMLYPTISWCYGSKKILWIQSVLGLLGLLGGVRGSQIKSWILVDRSDIWIPKCTKGGSPVWDFFLNFPNLFLVASLKAAQQSGRVRNAHSLSPKNLPWMFANLSVFALCGWYLRHLGVTSSGAFWQKTQMMAKFGEFFEVRGSKQAWKG